MSVTKLHESLFILYKCAKTVERIHNALEEHREKGLLRSLNHFSHNLAYYMIMETVSFLDEYNGSFVNNVEQEYVTRVKDVRSISAPVIKMINQWKDLRKFRHNIIAHPWRDQKNGHKFIIPHQKYFDIPRNAFEFQLLKDLVKYVFFLVQSEFGKEMDEAIYNIYRSQPEAKPRKDYSNLNLDLEKMVDEVYNRCQELKKPYYLQINLYDFEGNSD